LSIFDFILIDPLNLRALSINNILNILCVHCRGEVKNHNIELECIGREWVWEMNFSTGKDPNQNTHSTTDWTTIPLTMVKLWIPHFENKKFIMSSSCKIGKPMKYFHSQKEYIEVGLLNY
jgi:hypothetical protein